MVPCIARSKGPESESRYQRTVVQGQVQEAGQRLLERLREANINGQSQISGEDFQRALGEVLFFVLALLCLFRIFTSWQQLALYQDGYRLVTVHTHGDFMSPDPL